MKPIRIKAVLAEKGISQTWLAKQLGKSFSMVNAYVHHDVVNPQLRQPVMYPKPAEPYLIRGVVLRVWIVTCQEPMKDIRVCSLAHPLQHRGL